MAVDQEHGSWREAWGHGWGVFRVELDKYEALPGVAVTVHFRTQLAEESLFELADFLDVHGGDERLGGGGGIGEEDVFELVVTRGKDGGALVDLGRVQEVEDGEVLHLEDFVHAFDTEAALAVEEIRDVGLFESGLLGEFKAGQVS